MEVILIDREPVHLAVLRSVGPFGEPLGRFWGDTVAPWMATNGLFGRPRYGVTHDDPTVTDPSRSRYDAGVEIASGTTPQSPALAVTVAGGRYAAMPFRGTSAQIGEAWRRLLRDWLPSSGQQLDARPFFEFYPADAAFDAKTGVFECQLCVPVMPR